MGIFTRMWAFVAGRPKARRSYDAASGAARFGDFSKSNLSANAELDLALVTLRNRARGLHRNEPFVRRWISQLKTNVVGEKGFVYRCRAKNDNGGIDRFGNDMIESLWKPWAKVVTADGIMCWEEFLAMAVETWGRDGEFFVEKVRLKQAKYSYALHPFEADLVDETYSRSARAGENEIRQGVEIDGFGRPIAYHVLTEHPGETVYGQRHAYKRRRRILADKIIHVFIKSRPGQVRGEPPMSAVMTSTKMLSGYREAEVTGRRLAASKMGFFKRMFQSGSGDIAPLADVETKDGILEMEVEPGKLSALPPGVEFEKFDMQTFSTDYEQFERQILRSISAGLDISYSNISWILPIHRTRPIDLSKSNSATSGECFRCSSFDVWLNRLLTIGWISSSLNGIFLSRSVDLRSSGRAVDCNPVDGRGLTLRRKSKLPWTHERPGWCPSRTLLRNRVVI